MYDVAIVGAGPAGSVLAYRLAAAGLRVALLERARGPRPKPCGGGLDAHFMNQIPEEYRSELLATVAERWVGRFTIRDGRRSTDHRLPYEMGMSTRANLDYFMASKAADRGVDFIEGFKLELISSTGCPWLTSTEGRRVQAAIVVGADGVHSQVAQSFDLGRPRAVYALTDWAIYPSKKVMDQYVDHAEIDLLPMSLRDLRVGYGWVFPKADHLSVGVGTSHNKAKGLAEATVRYIEERGLAGWRTERMGHWLAFAKPGARFVRGNVMVVGDAAGLGDPASGGGIGWAIWSANLAAEAITHCLAGEAPLSAYQESVERMFMRQYRYGEALRNNIIVDHMKGHGSSSRWWDKSIEVISDGRRYDDVLTRWRPGYWVGRAFQHAAVAPLVENPSRL